MKNLIGRRLITRVEGTEGDVKPDEELMLPLSREDQADDATGQETVEEPAREEETADVAVADPKPPATAFTKIEKSLAALGFFTPSSRRIKDQRVKRISFTREIDGKKVEVTAEILPTVYGLPITADQDKYLALQTMITDKLQSEGKIANPIRFTSAELLRLLNKRVRTGKNYKDVAEWLDVMAATTIISNGVVYIAGQKRFARDRFHVFERAVSVGKELEDGTIADANYVWLSPWQLDNINHNFLLPIDLETYQKLKNHIAKALVPLLQIWLYASHRAGSFEKRYDELCDILSLQKYKAPSLIARQFKPSLDELTKHEYLEKWRIEKTSDHNAYKIVLFHGPKFHRDRRKRIDQKSAAEAPIVIAQSQPAEPSLPEPGTIEQPATAEAAPAKNRHKAGREAAPATPASYDSSAEEHAPTVLDELVARGLLASAAAKLLDSLPPERLAAVPDYLEYWDSVKATNNVGPGFLYELIRKGDPLPATFVTKRKWAELQAQEERRNKLVMAKQALEFAYEDYRSQTIERFVAEQFPKEEFERRVQHKRRELAGQQNLWADRPEMTEQMARHLVRAEIGGQVPVLSFDDFCRREASRILSDYQIDPAELGLAAAQSESQQ